MRSKSEITSKQSSMYQPLVHIAPSQSPDLSHGICPLHNCIFVNSVWVSCIPTASAVLLCTVTSDSFHVLTNIYHLLFLLISLYASHMYSNIFRESAQRNSKLWILCKWMMCLYPLCQWLWHVCLQLLRVVKSDLGMVMWFVNIYL